MAARLTQSVLELLTSTNPSARVTQSVLEIIAIPANPPIPAATPLAIPTGSPYARSMGGCSAPPNEWDERAERLAKQYRRIRFPKACTIPEEYKNLLPWDEDFGAIPKQSVPIRETKGIVTPAPAAGDQVIFGYRVPKAYFGFLSGFFFQYSGVGFTQGSGDLVFRIKLNQRYVKDLSNVTFTLGSPKFPLPMTQGQILLSDQLLEMIVTVPNLSGLIQVGASTCYAGIYGFLWPYG